MEKILYIELFFFNRSQVNNVLCLWFLWHLRLSLFINNKKANPYIFLALPWDMKWECCGNVVLLVPILVPLCRCSLGTLNRKRSEPNPGKHGWDSPIPHHRTWARKKKIYHCHYRVCNSWSCRPQLPWSSTHTLFTCPPIKLLLFTVTWSALQNISASLLQTHLTK